MKSTKDKYPVFEANQILTNRHLNAEFEYLDEQDRLTRANLIGIGIVCGLEISLETGPMVRITKGCGITSEGYLILLSDKTKQAKDVQLELYKNYTLPKEIDYPTFKNSQGNQYALYELFEKGEPDGLPLASLILQDKAVLLFLELKKDDLRNCSPNNCDDRGAEVTVNVRKLLISKADLKNIIANANNLNTSITPSDLKAILEARLRLPDIGLPRYSVPNSKPVTTLEVLSAYFRIFKDKSLANRTGKALSAAYKAFKPILEDLYPTDPFANFRFNYFDVALKTTLEVRFLQYLYDLFDDLLKAYNEFRWKGIDLLCACCPPETLFPRHLMLGLLVPDTEASIYRHTFLASGANSDCELREAELRLLFRRLVEMTEQFTVAPLAKPVFSQLRASSVSNTLLDDEIRITPSKLADVPLSDKAIPYYYLRNTEPTLFQFWNAQKNRHGKADQNLSYWATDYASLDYVQKPLEFDLEPYNFLRIEGHIGKNVTTVLRTLLDMRDRFRLPIAVIALRAGAFNEKIVVYPAKDKCRFEDLEALYDTMKADLQRFLFAEMTFLYARPLDTSYKLLRTDSDLPLIQAFSPTFPIVADSLGGYFENLYQKAGENSLFRNALPPDDGPLLVNRQLLFVVMRYMESVFEALKPNLTDFNLTVFVRAYILMERAVKNAKTDWEKARVKIADTPAEILNWEEVADHLNALENAGRSEAFKSVYAEYLNRLKELKQKQFFSYFLTQNPGIQHKAGVPLGGTFILVVNDDPDPVIPILPTLGFETAGALVANPIHDSGMLDDIDLIDGAVISHEDLQAVDAAAASSRTLMKEEEEAVAGILRRLGKDGALMKTSTDLQALYTMLTGIRPPYELNDFLIKDDAAALILAKGVEEIGDDIVFADFFLPYICCSDCAPIQFVLPQPPVSFLMKLGCTDADTKKALVAISVQSGAGPYSFSLDEQLFQPLAGVLSLSPGKHTITLRDANGAESAPQQITVKDPLILKTETYTCFSEEAAKTTYEAKFEILGGTAPYTVDTGKLNGNIFTSDRLASGAEKTVTVTDNAGCKAIKVIKHNCPLPKPVFAVDPMCTPPTGPALVTLTFSAGKQPYQYNLDGHGYKALLGPIPMDVSATPHTLVISDANGMESAPVNIKVAAPIVFTPPVFTCFRDANGKLMYQVAFDIQGGLDPITVDTGTLTGRHYVSKPLASGAGLTVTITDSAGCVQIQPFKPFACLKPAVHLNPVMNGKNIEGVFLDVKEGTGPYRVRINDGDYVPFTGKAILLPPGNQYTFVVRDANDLESDPVTFFIPPLCDKPCEGISRKFAYRLWIQPTGKFDLYTSTAVACTFTDEKGKSKNITELSVSVLPELLNKDFNGTIKALIDQVNARIGKAIGDGRLVLSYEPGAKDAFARLWIEYFECEMFDIRFGYTYAQPGPLQEYEVQYVKNAEFNGTIFTNLHLRKKQMPVPAFDGSVRNQCQGTSLENISKETLPALNIQHTILENQLTLKGSAIFLDSDPSKAVDSKSKLTGGLGKVTAGTRKLQASSISEWIWEVDRSPEAFYSGEDVVVQVPNLFQGTTVKLTAITKQGGFISIEKKIPAQK